jgi:hypothetical protein
MHFCFEVINHVNNNLEMMIYYGPFCCMKAFPFKIHTFTIISCTFLLNENILKESPHLFILLCALFLNKNIQNTTPFVCTILHITLEQKFQSISYTSCILMLRKFLISTPTNVNTLTHHFFDLDLSSTSMPSAINSAFPYMIMNFE